MYSLRQCCPEGGVRGKALLENGRKLDPLDFDSKNCLLNLMSLTPHEFSKFSELAPPGVK